MFKETDYYDRKMNIWDCDKKIDLEKPVPQNLRYTNTIDTIIEFYKPVQSLKPIIFIGILTSNLLLLCKIKGNVYLKNLNLMAF